MPTLSLLLLALVIVLMVAYLVAVRRPGQSQIMRVDGRIEPFDIQPELLRRWLRRRNRQIIHRSDPPPPGARR